MYLTINYLQSQTSQTLLDRLLMSSKDKVRLSFNLKQFFEELEVATHIIVATFIYYRLLKRLVYLRLVVIS